MTDAHEPTKVEVLGTEPEAPAVRPPQVFSVSELQTQVATANEYPRSVTRAAQELHVLATESPQVAETQFYSLRRGQGRNAKVIEGPSIRFAELVAYTWGNLRVYGRVVDVLETEVVAEGYAWDIQKNVAIAKQVRRRIVDRQGRRYSGDMVTVTGNAAISLAIRNAVLALVPRSIWARAYDAALVTATGDSASIGERRAALIAWWEDQGRERQELWEYLGVNGERDLGPHELRELVGLKTAVEEGSTTVDWAMRSVLGDDVVADLDAFREGLRERRREHEAKEAPDGE